MTFPYNINSVLNITAVNGYSLQYHTELMREGS